MAVVDLIDYLHVLKYEESDLLSGIKDIDKLINALIELDDMVEMYKAKKYIVMQIKHLIVSKRQAMGSNSFDGHLLHTVVNGPPGCGKTHLGKILGKIWLAIGIISTDSDRKMGKCENEEHLIFLKDYMLLLSEIRGLYENQINMKARLHASYSHLSSIDTNIRTLQDNYLKVNSSISRKNNNRMSKTFSLVMKQLADAKCISKPQTDIYYDQRAKFLERIKKTEEKGQNETLPVKIVTRADFVANFMGQTADKTRKLLESNLGGIIIIDEAYTLITGERDIYGMEALTELNVFMTEHSDDIVVIFLGYKDLLEKTIFTAQPGLKSRCNWIIEVEGYSNKSLSQIFNNQLAKSGWRLSDDIILEDFFNRHKDDFSSFGRDTGKLCFFCKLAFSETVFENDELDVDNKIITNDVLSKAMNMLRANKIKSVSTEPPPPGLYQ